MKKLMQIMKVNLFLSISWSQYHSRHSLYYVNTDGGKN